MNQQHSVKELNRIKKEIEDYYKSWVHKNFQKGVKDAKVYLGDNVVVIIGIDVLSFIEMSILDDQYSRQVVCYTRKKIVEKNFLVLKNNIELISGRIIEGYYFDISVDRNTSCMTFITGERRQ